MCFKLSFYLTFDFNFYFRVLCVAFPHCLYSQSISQCVESFVVRIICKFCTIIFCVCVISFRYFTLFKNLLNECTEGQELEQKGPKAAHANKLQALRNATIQVRR